MRVLLVRANRNERDVAALAQAGIDTVIDPYLSISAINNAAAFARMRAALTSGKPTWLVVTSPNVVSFLDAGLGAGTLSEILTGTPSVKTAAIGDETARQLREFGAVEVFQPLVATSEALAIELCTLPPALAVLPVGSIAMRELGMALSDAGFTVVREVIYQTEPVLEEPSSVAAIASGAVDAVVLRSPSAVRAFVNHNGVPRIRVFCTGPTTARQARELGLQVTAVSPDPSPTSLADTIARALKEETYA